MRKALIRNCFMNHSYNPFTPHLFKNVCIRVVRSWKRSLFLSLPPQLQVLGNSSWLRRRNRSLLNHFGGECYRKVLWGKNHHRRNSHRMWGFPRFSNQLREIFVGSLVLIQSLLWSHSCHVVWQGTGKAVECVHSSLQYNFTRVDCSCIYKKLYLQQQDNPRYSDNRCSSKFLILFPNPSYFLLMPLGGFSSEKAFS